MPDQHLSSVLPLPVLVDQTIDMIVALGSRFVPDCTEVTSEREEMLRESQVRVSRVLVTLKCRGTGRGLSHLCQPPAPSDESSATIQLSKSIRACASPWKRLLDVVGEGRSRSTDGTKELPVAPKACDGTALTD